MWLISEYVPTSLFSLKPAWATSSGGKSLLLPTPFAVKMALLDAACRVHGRQGVEHQWDVIRALTVALSGPDQIVVTNTFTRILKLRRGTASPGSAHAGPYQKSIGFREYVYHAGPIGIALQLPGEDLVGRLTDWLLQISYLGKRGGFVQMARPPQVVDALPDGFFTLPDSDTGPFPLYGILHQVDDTGPDTSFDRVNIYSDKKVRLGKDRILRHVVLPYRLVRSSKGYSHYQRID